MPTDPTLLTTTRPADPIGPSANPAPLLIPDTAAAALAGVSRAHWQRLRAAGKVPPSIKLGRAVRWRRAEVEAWVEAGCPDGRTWTAMRDAAARRTRTN